MKFFGSFLLFLLFAGHLALLGFFLIPPDKLMASILGDAIFISASDIPPAVEEFLLVNKVLVKANKKSFDGFYPNLVMGILTLRQNKLMSASERLALNLNLLSFGENVIGIEAASQYYFQKSTSELTAAQWIILINLQKIFLN